MTEYARKHHYELKDVVKHFVDLYPTVSKGLKPQDSLGIILKHKYLGRDLLDSNEKPKIELLKKHNAIKDIGTSPYAIISNTEEYDKALQICIAINEEKKEDIKKYIKSVLVDRATELVNLPFIPMRAFGQVLCIRTKPMRQFIKEVEDAKVIKKEEDEEGIKYTILNKDKLLTILLDQIEKDVNAYEHPTIMDD